ncbi:MAG: alanine--tRNA ligase-related protein [Candidatus Nanohaloarchaea archaeon]
MRLDELKREIKEEASENPEKFFATDVLREKGFERGRCENCGMYFWSSGSTDRKVCGEPECSGGYTFISDSPTDETFSYVESWKKFRDFMKERGYEPIDRYPVVARWRDDVEFVGGSIYNFQPYVVSGEAEPPAPELVVPQPSLRFNDVDNVGITGRHYVLHDHIGQTCFRESEEYDQDRYFRDMFEFAIEGLEIPREKLVLHEDSWGGGGNLGACMEFFVNGLELWNQVYMFYEVTEEGYEELSLKVLDMGMGHERITWISHGTETSYGCVMPDTLEEMKKRSDVEVDQELWEAFLPYSSELNVDEVDDIDEKWTEIAGEIGVEVEDLKDAIKPAAALYSVAEHMRALLFALADGKLPSNTGGGHNLRMVYRRAKDFVEKYNWDFTLVEVARWNAEELEPMFPELLDSMDEVEEIMEVEARKYERARKKAEEELSKVEDEPSIEEMIELYESHGVSPEMMEERGFDVPEDFYARLGDDAEVVKQVEKKFDVSGFDRTEKLYYERREPYRSDGMVRFGAEVLGIVDGEWIVLDRTLFYPEGGGQEPDHGEISGFEVVDVQKESGVVLHHAPGHDLTEGDEIEGEIDGARREQLTQHHTATHMVNSAAREELGRHINQAGASKTEEKGRLDITHYEKPENSVVRNIETKVREIIGENHPVEVLNLRKSEAEQDYGFRIYQGGAPPGNRIRLIEIEDVDIEACGGTHLTETSHVNVSDSKTAEFVITGCKRIQDGVIRLEYRAGEAARAFREKVNETRKEIEDVLGSLTGGGDRFSEDSEEFGEFFENRRLIEDLCEVYSVEMMDLADTLRRFKRELEENEEKIEKLEEFLDAEVSLDNIEGESLLELGKSLFQARKDREKKLEELESRIKPKVEAEIQDGSATMEVPTENIGLLIQIAQELSRNNQACVTLEGEKGAVSASQNEENAAQRLEDLGYSDVQGDSGFAKAFS